MLIRFLIWLIGNKDMAELMAFLLCFFSLLSMFVLAIGVASSFQEK